MIMLYQYVAARNPFAWPRVGSRNQVRSPRSPGGGVQGRPEDPAGSPFPASARSRRERLMLRGAPSPVAPPGLPRRPWRRPRGPPSCRGVSARGLADSYRPVDWWARPRSGLGLARGGSRVGSSATDRQGKPRPMGPLRRDRGSDALAWGAEAGAGSRATRWRRDHRPREPARGVLREVGSNPARSPCRDRRTCAMPAAGGSHGRSDASTGSGSPATDPVDSEHDLLRGREQRGRAGPHGGRGEWFLRQGPEKGGSGSPLDASRP